MTRRLETSTGRGLLLAAKGEWIIALACVLYWVLRFSVRTFVVGFTIAGLIGLVSIRRMWIGQDEFGPTHGRSVRRGVYLFLAAVLLFGMAFLSFQTFPTGTGGTTLLDNNTTAEATDHRFRDLIPPVVLFSAAIVVEILSGASLMWELVGPEWRRWVMGYVGIAVGGAAALLWAGIGQARALESENGSVVATSAASTYFYDLFLHRFLSVAAIVLLISRVAAIVLVRHTQEKVAEAEADFEPGPTPER